MCHSGVYLCLHSLKSLLKPASTSAIAPAAGTPRCGRTSTPASNLIHIIDVRETIRGLLRAKKYLAQVSSQGSLVLFVGTKRQAADTIEREAERCGMPFVSDRWLGGTLTNFRTIRSRLSRLEELEAIRDSDEINTYSKKMQSALNREYRKMYRNLNGMRTMNRLPECLVIIDPKKEKNAVSEAQQAGHRHGRADRYRLRSGPGRSADSRQRRQHAVDRVDRARCWPTRSWPARTRPPSKANTPPKAPKSQWHKSQDSFPRSAWERTYSAAPRRDPSRNAIRRRASHDLAFSTHERGNEKHTGVNSMAEITAAMVMKLRDETGLPMMDCKKALQERAATSRRPSRTLRETGKKIMAHAAGSQHRGRPHRRLHQPQAAASAR